MFEYIKIIELIKKQDKSILLIFQLETKFSLGW